MQTGKRTLALIAVIGLLLLGAALVMAGCGGGSGSGSSYGTSNTGYTYTRYAFVTNSNEGTVGFINLSSNAYETTVSVGTTPYGIAADPAGSLVFVSTSGDGNFNTISVPDKKVVAVYGGMNAPKGVAEGPLASYVLIASSGDGYSYIYNAINKGISDALQCGGNPLEATTSNDNKRAYVSNTNNSVSVVDLSTGNFQLLTNIPNVGNADLDVDPDGTSLFVADSANNRVNRVDTASFSTTATIPVGTNPYGVACGFQATAGYVYVSNRGNNNISVINATTNTVTTTIPVGTTPMGLCLSPDGKTLYVCNNGANNVSIIDTTSNTVTATVAVGAGPINIDVSPY
ncbi:MAG: YncE family protein [Candidatus Eremiobacteraeota bacterium]|nr:YncE family protein [Candidatus Eremiobacteraeota bacterium]